MDIRLTVSPTTATKNKKHQSKNPISQTFPKNFVRKRKNLVTEKMKCDFTFVTANEKGKRGFILKEAVFNQRLKRRKCILFIWPLCLRFFSFLFLQRLSTRVFFLRFQKVQTSFFGTRHIGRKYYSPKSLSMNVFRPMCCNWYTLVETYSSKKKLTPFEISMNVFRPMCNSCNTLVENCSHVSSQ